MDWSQGEDRMNGKYFFCIYAEKAEDENPYYTSQKGLYHCSTMIERLILDYQTEIIQWDGGARSGLKEETKVTIAITSRKNKEQVINDMLDLCEKYACKLTVLSEKG